MTLSASFTAWRGTGDQDQATGADMLFEQEVRDLIARLAARGFTVTGSYTTGATGNPTRSFSQGPLA